MFRESKLKFCSGGCRMAVKLNWKDLENKCRKQAAQFWFLREENKGGGRKGESMEPSLWVYTPKSLDFGADHSRLEIARWSGAWVPLWVLLVPQECWHKRERTEGGGDTAHHPAASTLKAWMLGSYVTIHDLLSNRSPSCCKNPYWQQAMKPFSYTNLVYVGLDLYFKLFSEFSIPVTMSHISATLNRKLLIIAINNCKLFN